MQVSSEPVISWKGLCYLLAYHFTSSIFYHLLLTTDLPDSMVHRRRRYRRTTTSKQASFTSKHLLSSTDEM